MSSVVPSASLDVLLHKSSRTNRCQLAATMSNQPAHSARKLVFQLIMSQQSRCRHLSGQVGSIMLQGLLGGQVQQVLAVPGNTTVGGQPLVLIPSGGYRLHPLCCKECLHRHIRQLYDSSTTRHLPGYGKSKLSSHAMPAGLAPAGRIICCLAASPLRLMHRAQHVWRLLEMSK